MEKKGILSKEKPIESQEIQQQRKTSDNNETSKEKEKEKEKCKTSKESDHKPEKEQDGELEVEKTPESRRSMRTKTEKRKDGSFEILKKDRTESKRRKKIDNRKKWALRISNMKCIELSKCHKDKLKGYKTKEQNYKSCEANQALNRYSDVLCADETRVILKNRENDYIHASWMIMPDKKTKYILTQGPLTDTISDFWAMIYQEKIKFILMLCTMNEGGIEKCSSYYPEKKGEEEKFGNFEVKNIEQIEEQPIEGVIKSIITIQDIEKDGSEILEINHLLVTFWPDQLAPEDPKPIINLYKWVKKNNPPNIPICVHCSAGVGRTATFVGIDYCNIRIQQDAELDLVDAVREMRSMRFQAVQTHLQFLFLHVCLLQYFIDEGIIEKDELIQNFMDQYSRHANRKLEKRTKA